MVGNQKRKRCSRITTRANWGRQRLKKGMSKHLAKLNLSRRRQVQPIRLQSQSLTVDALHVKKVSSQLSFSNGLHKWSLS